MNINVAQKFSSFQYCVSLMIDCITYTLKMIVEWIYLPAQTEILKKKKMTFSP